ncbi:MAG: hypothetical protein RLY72_216, partial [Planctomycetota bacterium]
ATITEGEIPADLKDKADLFRAELIEKAAEVDDVLMEQYLSDASKITNERSRRRSARAPSKSSASPCSAARR